MGPINLGDTDFIVDEPLFGNRETGHFGTGSTLFATFKIDTGGGIIRNHFQCPLEQCTCSRYVVEVVTGQCVFEEYEILPFGNSEWWRIRIEYFIN